MFLERRRARNQLTGATHQSRVRGMSEADNSNTKSCGDKLFLCTCLFVYRLSNEKQQNSVSTKTSPRVVQSTNPSTILTQSHFFFSCCHLFPSDRLHAARLFETDMKQTQRRTLSFHACLLHASVRACARVCVRTPVSRSTCLRVSANGAAGLKRAEARAACGTSSRECGGQRDAQAACQYQGSDCRE